MARVLVPLAQGCEELEAVTIIDLLRRAGIEVVTAGLEAGPVTGSRGTVLVPDTTLDAVADETFDMVALPGGLTGATNLDADPRLQLVLSRQAEQGRWCAAICAAPLVLANLGLLDGREATSFPGALDTVKHPRIQLSEEPVITDGKVVTSRGPGTAMDFALQLIELLAGSKRRDEVESKLMRPR